MSNTSSITLWLDHLVNLLPPKAIRLVGAGKGTGIWAQWLAAHSHCAATLVEADPQQFSLLQRQQAEGKWTQATLLNTVIAPYSGDVDFFTGSLSAESGLLQPQELCRIWPNLHTLAIHTQVAMDLVALLQHGEEQCGGQQWLLLDCLPAAAFLRNAQAQLHRVDVVVVRVLCTVDEVPSLSGMGASLQEVTETLPGFRVLALQSSCHPALAHALFVRDYRSAVQQALADLQSQLTKAEAEKVELLKKQELQAKSQQALQADFNKIIQARDAEVKARQTAQQVQLGKPLQKLSSDADIDEFIEDIAPFFHNCSIIYVDVGAYVGEVFTKLIDSKKLKLREAHLIEPNPESYRKLQDAAKSSKLPSCNTYRIGISNHLGKAKFKAAQSMTKRVRFDISNENSSNLFEIECHRFDDIAEIFTDGRAHLVKLDVEGEELDVLKSAERLLIEKKIDVLYIEVGWNRSGTQQTYFGDIDTLLQGYGYRVFKIYEQKNEWIDDSPLLRRCNVAYMSSQFASTHFYSKMYK